MPDEPRQETSTAARKPSSRDAFRRVFPGVMLAMFLAAADQTILASALPSIASALGVIADLSWVVVAYLLAATVAAPLYGYVGDRFGRRRALLGALAVFTVASCACSLAPSFWWLVGFRALQGLGGGGLMTLAQALIGEHVAPRERGRYAGYFATVFALASTSGPVLGAYLTEHVSWRAIFLINIPLGVIAAALAMRVPHVAPRRRAGPFRPDVAGAILFCIATAAFLFAISSGGHRFPWLSLPMAVLLAVTAGAFAALAWWERRHHDPIIPIHFLKVPAIARADAVVLCFGACLFPLIVYLPLVPATRQGHRHRRVGRAAPAHHSRAGDLRGDHGSPRHPHRARDDLSQGRPFGGVPRVRRARLRGRSRAHAGDHGADRARRHRASGW